MKKKIDVEGWMEPVGDERTRLMPDVKVVVWTKTTCFEGCVANAPWDRAVKYRIAFIPAREKVAPRDMAEIADKVRSTVMEGVFKAYEQRHIDVFLAGGVSDGSTASYYELPKNVSELQHLISHRDMNAQIGEIFRSCYRYGIASHSDQLRDAKKIRFYINAEIERLEKLK